MIPQNVLLRNEDENKQDFVVLLWFGFLF